MSQRNARKAESSIRKPGVDYFKLEENRASLRTEVLGGVTTFATMAYQQAALVLDWPFASALAVSLLVILAIALVIFAGVRRLVFRRHGVAA